MFVRSKPLLENQSHRAALVLPATKIENGLDPKSLKKGNWTTSWLLKIWMTENLPRHMVSGAG